MRGLGRRCSTHLLFRRHGRKLRPWLWANGSRYPREIQELSSPAFQRLDSRAFWKEPIQMGVTRRPLTWTLFADKELWRRGVGSEALLGQNIGLYTSDGTAPRGP